MFKPINFRINGGLLRKECRGRITEGSNPVISWAVLGGEPGAKQSAYCITIACSDERLWDSGWVESGENRAVYAGDPIPSGRRITLSVTLRDDRGNESAAGEDWFLCGDLADWNPVWIGKADETTQRPLYFRRDFTCDEVISSDGVTACCLSLCGLGYHKAYLNGVALDSSALDPAHADYAKTCYYAVIEINPTLIRKGANTLAVIVADGWRYNDSSVLRNALGERKVSFYGPRQLAARLDLFDAHGKRSVIATGNDWLCGYGAITESGIYSGEVFNANEAVTGWNAPDMTPDDLMKHHFKPADILPAPGGVLRPMTLEPIRACAFNKPVEIYSPSAGVHIVDFGQNLAGVVMIKLPTTLCAGQTITIAHAEELDEDGTLYTAPLRGAKATDTYIAAGDARDLPYWQPLFTYHGFRYARIEGLELLAPEDITAVFLHTDLENRSSFSCGSALANKIHENIVMTERANMHSILTDCPQRDERMQWLNDATVRFEETPYNFEIGRMFPKIIQDIIDTQDAEGAFACCSPYVFGGRPADAVCSSFLVAGKQALDFMGDLETVRRAYTRFEAWEQVLLARSDDYIVSYSYYGDWAGPAYACVGDDGALSAVTPGILMSTGYSYYNAKLLAGFAKKLGDAAAAAGWNDTAAKIRAAFLAKWYDAETGRVDQGSQGAQAFALWLDILPEEGRPMAAKLMRDDLVSHDYRITTGNLCTRYLLDMLARYGYADDAWTLMTREDYPSFGYMIQNEATTIWERFELKKNPGMNSHSHPMFGAAGYWFYAWLCGIRRIEDGFARFSVDPVYPTGLLYAHAVVETVRGELSVRWARRYGKFVLAVNVPFGSVAQVRTPDGFVEAAGGYHVYEWADTGSERL